MRGLFVFRLRGPRVEKRLGNDSTTSLRGLGPNGGAPAASWIERIWLSLGLVGKKKPALPGVFSALHDWLARKVSLPSPAEIERVIVDDEFGGFVGLEHRVPVHNASDLPPQNLQGSWEAVSEYLHEAMVVISNDIEPGWLDREEVEMVIEQLGNPPPMCLPLYFISVGSGAEERLVYVGKTSSNVARFDNGHAAFTKLHAPEYDGQAKHIYLASVVLLAQYGQL
ncbi:MAG: hypothetical protein JWR63_4504, partial [Conexibacter sp.]|nr:hypothetical protein [Conexibacter sp.]